ncbi:sushi, von Willebrand factor type A, EGF and pentraxin domain-containing protein 1-like isoform X2 [Biomphalaria glabrata]|nr:sushi, von Willebrand factor type A, EGF and pentraxin domain-containing protein 1-like isoform X2 [Biomphalaria glabrata]XP_055866863.1 sushi, von Willebrand factor type A, EGF and pentraxin domain-containing protein 1-like isoform X2 [Biomphalaria glabrata]
MTEKIGSFVNYLDGNITSFWTGYKTVPSDSDIDAVWSDGSPTSVDVGVWGDGEPNLQAGSCAFLRKTNGNWLWYMGNCDQMSSVVCERSPCPVGTFHCDSGLCLSSSLVCNGEDNCGDFSDERNCSQYCAYYISSREKTIQFPSSPQIVYPQQQTCQWVIEGEVGKRLQFEILEFSTEYGVDFLEIWVGGRSVSTSGLLARLSGTLEQVQVETPLYSPNNLALLRFVSDKTISSSGFQIRWRSDFECDLLKAPGLIFESKSLIPISSLKLTQLECYSVCLQDTLCVALTFSSKDLMCYKSTQMPRLISNHEKQLNWTYIKTCPGLSGKQILGNIPVQPSTLYATTRPQQLMSPLYPFNYPSQYTYIWTIYSPGRRLVTVEIIDIELGNEDYLQIYDGSTLDSNILDRLSSQSVYSNPIISTGNSILIYFSSTSFTRAKGFLLSYKAGCSYEVTANEGEIHSPGFYLNPSVYPNVLNCTWIINSEQRRPLKLTFTNFSLESEKDYLQIYKDLNEIQAYPGLGYTGELLPFDIESSDGRVKVVMLSSAVVSGTGFRAYYKTGCIPLNDTSLVLRPLEPAFHGVTYNVTCPEYYIFDKPYKGLQSLVITCDTSGVWDKAVPSCTRVVCSSLPTVQHGHITRTEDVFSGSYLHYVCNTGYKSINGTWDGASICNVTGDWVPLPSCLSISQCAVVLAPSSGHLTFMLGNGTEQGSTLHFSCTYGFELIGAEVITCINGSWSSEPPKCIRIKCGLPYIENATMRSPSLEVGLGDLITVTCLPGFYLSGSSTFFCGTPSVLPSCININECNSSQTYCNQLCADEIGSFKCLCLIGYTLSADNHTCTDIDECSMNNGYCEQLCTNTIGSYVCSCPRLNATLFQQDGQSDIFIPESENGLEYWNVYYLNHSCIEPSEIMCPKLSATVTNGMILSHKSRYTAGDTVTYLCLIGFSLVGSNVLTCLTSGQWDGTPPTCKAATCSTPKLSSSVVSPSFSINYLQYFNATCTVQGLGEVAMRSRCVYDIKVHAYQAEISSLQCPAALTCEIPSQLPGTEPYMFTSTTYGSSFIFKCKGNFMIQGQSSISRTSVVTCMSSGFWDFGDLRCMGASCNDPGTSPGVQQITQSYEEYSLVYYQCERSDFELTDKRPLLCEWNTVQKVLQWNSTVPHCVDVEPPKILHCDTHRVVIEKLTAPNLVEPIALDNVEVASFTKSPVNFYMSHVVSVNTTITYTARDFAGNQATCTIDIVIKDELPPTLQCISSFTYTLTDVNDVKSFDLSQFVTSLTDDSSTVNVMYSPANLVVDRFSNGQVYTVKISASDLSGNSHSCLVQVKVQGPVCSNWSLTVRNASISCIETLDGYMCTVVCEPGYVFYENPLQNSVNMSCTQTQGWSRKKPVCVASHTAEYNSSLGSMYSCYKNEELKNISNRHICVSCPPGLLTSADATCTPCPAATYLDSIYEDCLPCPAGSNWLNTGATSVMDCYLTCPDGYTSASGEAVCQICPVNQFSFSNQLCSGCQPGQYTTRQGQGSVRECRDPCLPGYYSKDGLQPCLPCPRGFYQSSSQAKSCSECSSNFMTDRVASTSASDCKDGVLSLCDNLKCFNGGTCQVSGHQVYCICPEGSSGRQCEVILSPCNSQPCYNQGICVPTGSTTYRCDCPYAHISGMNCEINNNDICSTSSCGNDGICQPGLNNFTCHCPSYSPYTNGPAGLCDQLRNPCNDVPCENGATCQAYGNIRRTCQCLPGYTGDSCQIDMDSCQSSPCKNNGSCHDGPSNTFVCICPEKFSGDLCEIRINRCTSASCPAFAYCVDDYLTNQMLCLCQEGFIQDVLGTCVQNLYDACNPSPCQNGGTCYKNGDSYICNCITGYVGANCQHNFDDCEPNPCLNGGVCTDLQSPSASTPGFTCQCPLETFGSICTDNVNICEGTMNPCNRLHSTCIDLFQDYYCQCDAGYFGKNCTKSNNQLCDSFPCQHGGTCVESLDSHTCHCAPGYTGSNCESFVDFCLSLPCYNNATCVSYEQGYMCSCMYGYTGGRCENTFDVCLTSNPCQGKGSKCIDRDGVISCACESGYSGIFCQIKDVQCSSDICLNGGTCQDNVTQIYCDCLPGFEGFHCELNPNDCLSNVCPEDSVCIDGLNSYTCQCLEGRLGNSCKIVPNDFDLILTATNGYQLSDYQQMVQPINTTSVSISTWIRYTQKHMSGIILSFYGCSTESDYTSVTEMVRLESYQPMSLFLELNEQSVVIANVTLADGLWHHVAVTYDAGSGHVALYIDGLTVWTNSTIFTPFLPYGWLILGGEYKQETHSVSHSNGMIGRLSRVYITNTTLTQSEVKLLITNISYIPNGWISGFTTLMASGRTAPVDFQSELDSQICILQNSCKHLTVVPDVKFVTCPSDQVIVTDRVSNPTWQSPTALNTIVVSSTLVSGQTKMGWGIQGAAYAGFDILGNADMCTFKIITRRTKCMQPKASDSQALNCTILKSAIHCSVQCNRKDYHLVSKSPKYYTCGTYGMYDSPERLLQFQFPPCSLCTAPLYDYTITLNYTFITPSSCGSSAHKDLENQLILALKKSLTSLQTHWPDLCATSCTSVPLYITCLNDMESSVHWTLPALGAYLDIANQSSRLAIQNLILISVIDEGLFTYDTLATPDFQSLVINAEETCPSGKVLVDHCCLTCAAGQFYNNMTKQCTECAKGTYQTETDVLNASVCRPCPAGTTTAQQGTTSNSECFTACPSGSYYNLTKENCSDCPVGFYSETAGQFSCDACDYTQTTAISQSTSKLLCLDQPNTILVQTSTLVAGPDIPTAAASILQTNDSTVLKNLLITLLVILLVIVILLLVFCCCLKPYVDKYCPCFVNRVAPEGATPWQHVNKFGETKIKFVEANMRDFNQDHHNDKELLVTNDNTELAVTNDNTELAVTNDNTELAVTNDNIQSPVAKSKLQIPVFEEKIDYSPIPKTSHTIQFKNDKEILEISEEQQNSNTEIKPQVLPPLKTVHKEFPPESTSEVLRLKRPPSAFNRPRPNLNQLSYAAFTHPSSLSPLPSGASNSVEQDDII